MSGYASAFGGTGGGGAALSAGASSQNTGTIIFSNSNGVSFGLNAGTMTASAAGGGVAFSADASSTFQTLSFQNSNGISFSNNAGAIRLTHVLQFTSATSAITSNALNTSASRVSGIVAATNNTGGGTATLTGGVLFSSANGLTFYTSAGNAVVASYTVPAAGSQVAFSADASSTFLTLSFQNTSNVSFSNNAGAIRIQHGLAGSSSGSQSTAGSDLVMTHNSSGLNLGVPKWLTTYVAQTNVAFSADASSTFQTLSFQNTSNVSFSNNAGAIRILHNLAGTGTAITGNASITLNSTGLSFNGSGLAGTSTGITGNASITLNSSGLAFNGSGLAGTGTAATNATFTLNSAGLSLSVAAPSAAAITQSFGISNITQGGSTAGTTGAVNGDDIQFVFVPGSNITMSQSINGSSGTLSIFGPAAAVGATYSYFGTPADAINTVTMSFAQSTSYFVPVVLPQNLSLDRMRLIASGSVAASSTQATTGNISYSISAITSHNIVIYSRGAGGNSLSLQYLTSTQVVDQQLITISYAAGNSTQYTVSNRLSIGGTSFTKDYSISSGTVNWHTSNLTDLTGVKQYDVALGLSLAPGQYWVGYGRSTTFATGNANVSVGTRMLVSFNSMIGVTQNTLAIGTLGSGTNSSVGWQPGLGSFTTGGAAGTTNSLGIDKVSTTASNQALYMQFMRIV